MVLHEDVFGFFLPAYVGQGSPGQKKGRQSLWKKFPEMTKLETVWLRMALKLYRGTKPHARDLLRMDLKPHATEPHARDWRATVWAKKKKEKRRWRATTKDSSFWAIKCILHGTYSCKIEWSLRRRTNSQIPNLTSLPMHPRTKYIARLLRLCNKTEMF